MVIYGIGRLDRRRGPNAIWWAANGAMMGFCTSNLSDIYAQTDASVSIVQAWLQPSAFLSVVTMIFAFGMMWQARVEDRRRIQKLEDTYVTRDMAQASLQHVERIEEKIDRMLERCEESRSK